MDVEKLIKRIKCPQIHSCPMDGEYPSCAACQKSIKQEAATALSTLQAENEKLRAELEQAKRERDAAIKDIDSILAKAELIRRKISYCLDYDSDAELAILCVDYCKNNVCEMCYEEREDGGCGNFLWRGQKED